MPRPDTIVTAGADSRGRAIPRRVLIYIAWRNLIDKKLRAFLTIFGVVIGIGAIYFLLSFGIGLQHLVTGQIIGNKSIKSVDVTTTNSKIIKLTPDNLQKIKNLPHVVQIGGQYSFAASLAYKGGDVDAVVYGIDQNYQTIDDLPLVSGRLLSPGDNKKLIINQAALRTVGLPDGKAALGKSIKVKIPLTDGQPPISQNFEVVGIVNTGAGTEIYVPDDVFQVAGVKTYSGYKLEVDESKNVAGLRHQIESLGFYTTSPIDTIDEINQIFKFFNIILAGFGAIGMIVAILGMFNTLTISLLERTREIGLMLALGGRNRDMRMLFVFEAMLLSVAGAVVGIFLAFLAGAAVNLVMNIMARHRGVTQAFDLFATPIWLTFGMILFMIVVGLLVVYFPARRAQRINPIDALRRE